MNWRDYRKNINADNREEKSYECDYCNRYFNKDEYEITNNKNECIFHCSKKHWITEDDPRKNEYNLGEEVIYFWNENNVKYFWDNFKILLEEKKVLSDEELYNRFNNFIFPNLEDNIFHNYIFNTDLEFNEMCHFEGNVNFFNSIFNGKIYFNNCEIKGKMNFGKSIFKNRFVFNDMTIKEEANFRFAEFEQKVEIKESSFFKEIDFEDVKFFKTTDFFRTNFINNVNFIKTDFKGISVFTETEFHKNINFKYTTFEKIGIFRDAIFHKEIDLRDTVIKEKVNFLDITSDKDIKKDISVSNRETARIIKDSFEQQNNIIEANKFYALEMKEREKELDKIKKDNLFEWIVFKIHSLSSNHSQEWTLALFWIINLTFFYSYLKVNLDENLILSLSLKLIFSFVSIFVIGCMTIKIPENYERRWLTTIPTTIICYVFYGYLVENDWTLSEYSKNINPFSIMRGDEPITFGTLLFKIIIAYLIYQLIISIRQNTRRK